LKFEAFCTKGGGVWNIQYAVLLQQNSRDLGLLVEGFGRFEASAGKGVGMDHSRRSAVAKEQHPGSA
jgi:hypothetical protein